MSDQQKSVDAFRTISEVSDALEIPQHVLRFWETKFTQVRPMKRGGNRRYYRPEDVDLLRRISHLLYVDGYTIKGVQKILRRKGVKGVVGDALSDLNQNGGNGAVPEGSAHLEPSSNSFEKTDGQNDPEVPLELSEMVETTDVEIRDAGDEGEALSLSMADEYTDEFISTDHIANGVDQSTNEADPRVVPLRADIDTIAPHTAGQADQRSTGFSDEAWLALRAELIDLRDDIANTLNG